MVDDPDQATSFFSLLCSIHGACSFFIHSNHSPHLSLGLKYLDSVSYCFFRASRELQIQENEGNQPSSSLSTCPDIHRQNSLIWNVSCHCHVDVVSRWPVLPFACSGTDANCSNVSLVTPGKLSLTGLAMNAHAIVSDVHHGLVNIHNMVSEILTFDFSAIVERLLILTPRSVSLRAFNSRFASHRTDSSGPLF